MQQRRRGADPTTHSFRAYLVDDRGHDDTVPFPSARRTQRLVKRRNVGTNDEVRRLLESQRFRRRSVPIVNPVNPYPTTSEGGLCGNKQNTNAVRIAAIPRRQQSRGPNILGGSSR